MERCAWCGTDPLYVHYHDTEWGVPIRDDQKLFEFLILDAFQAGLSWLTILRKRENFRRAFSDFNPEKIALYDEAKVEELMADTGIVRNKMKILATIGNAQQYLRIKKETGSFSDYIWSFVNGKTIVNQRQHLGEVPAKTAESDKMSKELKKQGFKFVGSTICYAFMQAAGLVNDHVVSCHRYDQV
jgi:DNA-3-methyladenine glycosylase I